MIDGHFALALARLASAAKDVGTRESFNLATGLAALGLAYDAGNEDVLVQLLGDCHLPTPVELAVPMNADEYPLMSAFVHVRTVGDGLRETDPLVAMTEVAIAMLAVTYFRRDSERLNSIADAMAFTATTLTLNISKRSEHPRAN